MLKSVPFEQKTGDLGCIKEKIVRPFEGETRGAKTSDCLDRLVQGKSGDEAELRRGGNLAGIDQQKAGIEVALRRRPLSAVPPPARTLFGGGDPELTWIAGSCSLKGVVVRRACRREGDQPVSGGLGLGRQVHDQNRELAAARAAATSGAGTMPKRTTKMLQRASTSLTPAGMAS